MANNDGEKSSEGSGGRIDLYKRSITRALCALQECHDKGSPLWDYIENAKIQIENETKESVVYHKLRILQEVFKKELDVAVDPPAKETK